MVKPVKILIISLLLAMPLSAEKTLITLSENKTGNIAGRITASLVTFLTESGLRGKTVEFKRIRDRTGMRMDTLALENRLFTELEKSGLNICPGYQPDTVCSHVDYNLNMAINSYEIYVSGQKLIYFYVSCSLYNLSTGKQDWVQNFSIPVMD